MSKKVTFLELTVFAGILPLASGYMEAYCRKDPELAAQLRFEKISLPVATQYEDVLAALERSDSDVYGFSCYVWNVGMVRRLLAALIASKPNAVFILGGPQVMHQGERYLNPEHENVFLCNGEGERTFTHFIRAYLSAERDFSAVRGISFYRDKQLVTTPEEPRINDLSEIPSPFLEGVFEKHAYTWTVIETNRGCPFKCNYCYWGAAIGSKVYKYDNERVERELSWICQSGCMYLFIADANWGMLPRDLELSKFIAENGKRYGAPMTVYFCGSKNTPERVAEITNVFYESGLLATQSVALQTMSPEALKMVNRDNIKTSTYVDLQRSLNERGISSLIEIIWPLPGETLASFRAGLAELCLAGADSFAIYPLLLMNNVELDKKRGEYGLVTIQESDPNGEAEVVIQTNQIGPSEYAEGLHYVSAVVCLHAFRGLWCLGRYLHSHGIMSYEEMFLAFLKTCRRFSAHPLVSFVEQSIKSYEFQRFDAMGQILHLNHHSERAAFDDLLVSFVTSQPFWRDPQARFFFEIDLLNRPYTYRNTKFLPKKHRFTTLRGVTPSANGYLVDVTPAQIVALREYFTLQGLEPSMTRIEVNHRRSQLPFMPSKPLKESYLYCQDISHRMVNMLPLWSAPGQPGKSRLEIATSA